MQPLVVLGRQRPHEVLLLAVSLLTGITYLVGAPRPGTLAALMPHWETVAWSVGLAASGVVGLAGCAWRRGSELGMRLEAAGMLIGAGALVLYVGAVCLVAGWRGLFSAAVVAAWAAANVWRAAQITRDMREF